MRPFADCPSCNGTGIINNAGLSLWCDTCAKRSKRFDEARKNAIEFTRATILQGRGLLRRMGEDDELRKHSIARSIDQAEADLKRLTDYELLRSNLESIAKHCGRNGWDSDGGEAVPMAAIAFCYKIFEQCQTAHEPVGNVAPGDGLIMWEDHSDSEWSQIITIDRSEVMWARFPRDKAASAEDVGFIVAVPIE